MFYQYINEYRIKPVETNGFIEVNGKRVGISNLSQYFAKHKDEAAANGYYELVEPPKPEYDESKQYIVSKYVVEDGVITRVFEVHDIPEEAVLNENTEHTESED